MTQKSLEFIWDLDIGIYPPSQKATGFKTVDECEGGYPSKLISSVVGYASEGSALRSMWRSHGL